jgi:hypothetical protein
MMVGPFSPAIAPTERVAHLRSLAMLCAAHLVRYNAKP